MASLPPKPPPSNVSGAPLPPGWTEHKAPTGHSYYYNAATKTSTYTRPVAAPLPPAIPTGPRHPLPPNPVYGQYPPYGGQPAPYAVPYGAPYTGPPGQFPAGPFPAPGHHLPQRPHNNFGRGGHHGGRGGHQNNRPRHPPKPVKPTDKPKRKAAIPGAEPWVLVTTKMGRTFVHNLETKESLWTAPKEVQEKIDVMPPRDKEAERAARQERRRRRAEEEALRERMREAERRQKEAAEKREKEGTAGIGATHGEEEGMGEPSLKKLRLEGEQEAADTTMTEAAGEEEDEEEEEEEEEEDEQPANRPPVAQEFTEDDIAWQLEAMAEQYGLEEEDFGEDDDELAPEESIAIFRDMLKDYNISPFSTWDDSLPKFVEDNRYTVLPTTKQRKEVFKLWCADEAARLREEKEKAKKIDPRIPFWAFLKERSTAKLYWAEFKRKWRKEEVMKNTKLTDKEREKMYRDYVARNKSSAAIRENDLLLLLKSIPSLSRQTTLLTLPDAVLADVRYVTAPEDTRDKIITDYLATCPDAPMSEAERKEKEEKERRERALRERELKVRRERQRNAFEEEQARMLLKEEEAALERAKRVDKKGLLSHFKKQDEGDGKVYEEV